MKKILNKYKYNTKVALLASAGCGPLGAFSSVADVAAIATCWGGLMYSMAKDSNFSLDKDAAIDICKSALLGMGGYYIGCKTATKVFLLIPGAGIIAGMGISSVANIIFTYRFALTLSNILESKRGSLDLENLAESIKAMYGGNGMIEDAKEIWDIWRNY